MELSKALPIAKNILLQLQPFCERIEIAGSIRREKEEVKDIEIVCIPKSTTHISSYDMFGAAQYSLTRDPGFIKIVNTLKVIKGQASGKYMQRILPEGIVLDLFTATPSNWGLILAIRTGSSEYSKKILGDNWVKRGYHSIDGMLHKAGKPVIVREEKELFDLIGKNYTEPKYRNL